MDRGPTKNSANSIHEDQHKNTSVLGLVRATKVKKKMCLRISGSNPDTEVTR